MAWDNSIIEKTVFGNKRVHILSITADSAEADIDTGLNVVQAYSLGPITMTTAAITLFKNVRSTGTAAGGYIGASAVTANDKFYLTVYGN